MNVDKYRIACVRNAIAFLYCIQNQMEQPRKFKPRAAIFAREICRQLGLDDYGFKPGTFEIYFGEFKKGAFDKFGEARDITDIIAAALLKNDNKKYSDFNDFSKNITELSKNQINEVVSFWGFSDTLKVEINALYYYQKNQQADDTFIDPSEFIDLEFRQTGFEVNCITSSLFWLKFNLKEHSADILKHKNQYKYILTEINPNLHYVQSEIDENPELKQYIHIHSLAESTLFGSLALGNIVFPVVNDIVIYRKQDKSGKYQPYAGIIGVIPDNMDDSKAIKLPNERRDHIYIWFKEVWKKLEKSASNHVKEQ